MTDAKGGGGFAGGSVVLMRDGAAGCEVLLRALSARGLMPQTAHDEAGAMLALAGFDRRRLARRVLIVVEPAAWPRLNELLAAVREYHGQVYCWQFDVRDGADPMLSQLETPATRAEGEAGVESGGKSGGDGERDGGGAGVLGRIRKRTRLVDRLLVSASGEEPATREVVTQQELTMLLGPAPGEAV